MFFLKLRVLEFFDFVDKPWLLPVAEHARLLMLIGVKWPDIFSCPPTRQDAVPTTPKKIHGEKWGDTSGFLI